MYPFLKRKTFEEKAFSPRIESLLETSIAWSALYHTVLALGSQFHDKGDFLPGKGLPWQLFKFALGMMPNLVGPDATLLNVQVWVPSYNNSLMSNNIGCDHDSMSCSICTHLI